LKVLDTHNLYFRFFESLLKSQKNWLTALLDKMQISKLKKYEKEVISLFDLVCVYSEKEKKILSEMVPTKIEVIPNGVDLALYQKLKKDQKDNNLLFIGPFDHLPNEAGIFWFIKKIFPKIQAKVKNVKLYIIGKKPSARILKLKKRQRIYILGYVHEIRPFFEKSKVFIVPLLSGAGTRIKILEAMAARIPVVSTQKGAEGIEVANRKNILIANSEKSFSQAVIQLLENDELCQKITDNAYELVKKKYTWAKSGQRLIEKIKGAK
jgi:glycosyltransferase involved in cell wall biosynthesis